MTAAPLLSVRNLRVGFGEIGNRVNVVDDVSFDIGQGEVFGLVGESGSGKSVTCRSIVRLFAGASAGIENGDILFEGVDLAKLPDAKLPEIRGAAISMIFQDPMTALNPTMSIGTQIGEVLRRHQSLRGAAVRARVLELLGQVGVPNPAARVDAYPHQFSGGMRQRVLIAMALACHPRLLIADEPTTALDVTVQDQILKLILRMRRETGTGVLLVTHDLGVVAQTCDKVGVMYAGRIVESGSVREIFARPSHPYTRALLRALPAGTSRKPLLPIGGSPPDLAHPPAGCRFHPRCPMAIEACRSQRPLPVDVGADHTSACLRVADLTEAVP
ncbi:ABC transporter ATP-binding protein [Microvirga sp. M2]|uniref:ABC transporter ATP-binding protein n=1 Tax=Microvirga sp. M2 TaxID=3073270 RepID=UPI0039C1C050